MNQNPIQKPPQKSRTGNEPGREAARRAYYEKKRRRIRRNRIILGTAAVLFLALIVLLLILLINGIRGAVKRHEENKGRNETQASDSLPQKGTEEPGTDDPGTGEHTDGTGTEPSGGTEEPGEKNRFPELPENIAFEADLSDYERYMNPSETDAYLLLVNAEHPLGANDAPEDLTDVVNTRKDGRDAQKMRYTAEKALEALYLEAQAEGMLSGQTPSGYVLSVTSAYRDYATQAYLFSSYTEQEMKANPSLTREQAEAIVETYSCRPGTSEHQTGLCCDMHTLNGADISFAKEEQAKWLADNAWKFGFILRFPEDKTEVTGISYEPWHFRFVGRLHAYRIHELNLCLEEYIPMLEESEK